MPSTRASEKTALRTGISQLAISLGLFGVISAVGVGAVQIFGDAGAAAPKVQVALFQPKDGAEPYLKPRISNLAAPDVAAAYANGGEPTLAGVGEYHEGGGDGEEGHTEKAGVRVISLDEPSNNASLNARPLAKSPLLGFYERTPAGDLPRISPEGKTPAEAYARPFTPNGEPRVSLILGGLGLNADRTLAAINTLPPEITLSFVPYATDLQTWINRARAAGHEVLLELPMEPYDYPNVDTGPHTLLIAASPEENVRRLELLLGKATGYFGVTNYQGAKFATDGRAAQPVFAALAKRGLVFMHDGGAVRSALPDAAKGASMNFRVADQILDSEPSADAIDAQLLKIEQQALKQGQSLGVGLSYPVTIQQLKSWAEGLKASGYQLAPASSAAGIKAYTPAAPTSALSKATASRAGEAH